MPRERDPPYVAAGFRCDAEKLISRFVAKSSLKFSDFAEIWSDLRFSTIFMGRESLRELTEILQESRRILWNVPTVFLLYNAHSQNIPISNVVKCGCLLHDFIEECYRNALLFMNATNPFQKVGVVYLLFSLYLKQPPLLLKSQVQIRISFKQALELHNLENYFLETGTGNDDVLDLIYIITKLFKMEAFNITCFPIPMGPAVPIPLFRLEPLRNSSFKEMLGVLRMLNDTNIKDMGPAVPIPLFRLEPLRNSSFKEMLGVLRMLNDTNIKMIDTLFKNCEEIKKQLPISGNESTEAEGFNKYEEMKEMIDELEDRYNSGLLSNGAQTVISNEQESDAAKLEKEFRSLGQRRALLKAQQFEMVANYRKPKGFGPSSDSSENVLSEEEQEEDQEPIPVKRGRGRPKKIKEVRRRKRKAVEDVAQTEHGAEAGRDYSQNETGVVSAQMKGETFDLSEMMHPVPFFPYRRPSKYPRPMRKLYFQSDDGEDEDY